MPSRKTEKLIFEKSSPGKRGYLVEEPRCRDDEALEELAGKGLLRSDAPDLPEVSETGVVRHFTRLSEMNYHLDRGIYPLGSCTMKYNPKMNERLSSLPGFTEQHPLRGQEHLQGSLELLWRLERFLSALTGFDETSLQPCAGAHGELTSLMMIKAFFADKGELEQRKNLIVPDSAHGTNPASGSMCGFSVKEVPSADNGCVEISAFQDMVDESCAAVMLTNPNTLGFFEEQILAIAEHCKKVGAKLYCDGANMNALVGRAGPGCMGFDIMHLNLHKTFSTPHGGGGPGSGPVACTAELAPYLPVPRVERKGDDFVLSEGWEKSIGPVHSFYGNVGVAVRAYAYIRTLGLEGLRQVSEVAVLNANYLRNALKELFELPYDRLCMHEFVLSGAPTKDSPDVHTMDIAKRLLDLGFHAPTVYFPLIVEEALMVEPSETVGKDELDAFIAAFEQIAKERREDPEKLKRAPEKTVVRRLDETTAARKPDLRFCSCSGD